MKYLLNKMITMLIMLSVLCGRSVGNVAHADNQKLQITTTFYPVYYAVKRVAGDHAEVKMMLDQGQDAHGYEPSARDITQLKGTDLFVYSHHEMEFFVPRMLDQLDPKTDVLMMTEGITLKSGDDDHGDYMRRQPGDSTEQSPMNQVAPADHHDHSDRSEEAHEHHEGSGEAHDHHEDGSEAAHEGEAHEHAEDSEHHDDHDHKHDDDHDHDHGDGEHHHHHDHDPHTWLDPMLYALEVLNVRDQLIKMDPANEADYKKNAEDFIKELDALEQEYQTQLKSLERRDFVVQHQAFGYIAGAYQLNQHAITGLQTNNEPSAKDLASMQQFMKDSGASVIYVDPNINAQMSEVVAQSTGATLLPLSTLEVVTPDDMQKGVDYFTVMHDNLKSLLQNK